MVIQTQLWSINKWLRWTGWRLFVTIDLKNEKPTYIGFRFYGWKGWTA